jgi:hypothetical protein
MTELRELICRAEMANGRDPWLNRDIEVALGRGRDCDASLRQKDAYAMPLHRNDYYVPPEYTRSFDAALTLLPRDMHINLHPFVDTERGKRRWCVGLVRLKDDDPALALVAAALRSHNRDLRMAKLDAAEEANDPS